MRWSNEGNCGLRNILGNARDERDQGGSTMKHLLTTTIIVAATLATTTSGG